MLMYTVPDEVAHFYENKTFMEDSSPESDALWQSLIPGRGGKYVISIISVPYLTTEQRGKWNDGNQEPGTVWY